jgi:hypothetical protein
MLTLQPDKKLGVVIMATRTASTRARTQSDLRIVAPALKNDPVDASLMAAYTGSYDAFPWDGETIIVPWATAWPRSTRRR